MKLKQRLACLLLAAALLTPLSIRAAAAEYTDLPTSHWAYNDMIYASWLGILNGVGNNQMAPSAPLSWGQYLAMTTRAFAPQAYQSAINDGLAWDQAGLQAAREAGLILDNDFLPVDEANLSAPITRQEVAVLLVRALPEAALSSVSSRAPSAEEILSDWNAIDPRCRDAVSDLVRLKIILGKDDGTFGGADVLRRCDGSVLLMRAVAVLDATLRYEAQQIALTFVDTQGNIVGSGISAASYVGQYAGSLINEYAPEGYTYDYQYSEHYAVSSIQNQYTLTVRAMTWLELQEEEFWAKVSRGEASFEDYYTQDFLLKALDDNPRKRLLLFGDQAKYRFASQAEAKANMVTVTVPVWKISNGVKVSSTASFLIHAALAEDVKEIFTEIYNDPEQFPIHDIGGFSWRGDTSTSEHNCGTAIDINANENYQIRYGTVETGSLWQPGANPYSIPADGSVVRIFAEHGWSWGGDAWAYSSDPSDGYHDYMHFSYMGG